MALQQFFYDEQIRRFLLQFTRMFSNYQVEYGRDETGAPTLTRVPVRYGDASRQAAVILQENSANKLPNSPLMTFNITSLEYDRDRIQEPFHVDKKVLRQREWDDVAQTYETTQGNAFTIERIMPVPFTLILNLDIWTTNTTMKLQLLEQILTLFNPAIEIQSTDNYIDWTSLTTVELTGVNWSSRSILMGTDNPIDIATLTFKLPIWISPPARVTKMGVIHKIISSIYDSNGDANNALLSDDLLLGTRQKITPFGYQVVLINNQLQLIKQEQVDLNNNSLAPAVEQPSNVMWHSLIDVYGQLRAGISQIRLLTNEDETEVVGTVTYHPTDDRFMLFDIDEDTIPTNTLLPVNAIIDPTSSGPGSGLVAASAGQRYLLIEDIGNSDNSDPSLAWGSLVAKVNDIIQYSGSSWQVIWRASDHLPDVSSQIVEYVSNLTTSIQYKWTGEKWIKSYQGLYSGGQWSLVL
jgi:hypothetical protein